MAKKKTKMTLPKHRFKVGERIAFRIGNGYEYTSFTRFTDAERDLLYTGIIEEIRASNQYPDERYFHVRDLVPDHSVNLPVRTPSVYERWCIRLLQ